MLDLPPTPIRFTAYAIVLLAFGLCVSRPSNDGADNPAYDALAKAHTRRMVADSLALADAQEKLVRHEAVASRQIVKYRTVRDSLVITDTVKVKEFVERADSVVRSCTDLQNSCERFRVRAESSLAGLRLDRDRWRLTAESLRPSRLDLFVRRTLPVLAFAGGIYVGSRVVR